MVDCRNMRSRVQRPSHFVDVIAFASSVVRSATTLGLLDPENRNAATVVGGISTNFTLESVGSGSSALA